ncbi:Na+/H+ antiporter subunit E [Ancylobacter sp. Lp-2]|uniref:Na+/H+ antiporter subunit E n=1 Tax=Ancylobacter sp. Lp-2 TaxID=2881339 RepID=UPI001E2CBC0E|nr:Na+/H+ antiporter subunit E [Ancylobacter sp. Lp-2]MCB4769330.1 Na+/H+ antiporter subunit E [Ancylobacter sp. Lp-2]
MRTAGFLLLWLVLTDGDAAKLPVGLLAAGAAAWISLHLLPPGDRWPDLALLLRLVLRLAATTVAGGIDVARRAFSPSLPLAPGLIRYRPALPPSPARDGFRAAMGLQPGALPFEAEDGDGWLVHCLDTEAPIAATLAEDETRWRRALRSEATS